MTRPDAGTPAYRTAGLAKVYGEGHSAVHALRGLYLEIRAGEIVALLGSSGFGKTILLNIVGGLDRGTQGTAHFRDQCLSDRSDAQLTRADYVTENAPLVQIDSRSQRRANPSASDPGIAAAHSDSKLSSMPGALAAAASNCATLTPVSQKNSARASVLSVPTDYDRSKAAEISARADSDPLEFSIHAA